MDEDISTLLGRYERLLSELHLALDDIEGRKADALRIEGIHGFLQRFGDLSEFVAYINGIQDSIYVLKESLTSKEAAKYPGISLSYQHKLTMQNELPYYTPFGRRLYFRREELDKWMSRNRHPSREEMIAEASRSEKTNLYAEKCSRYHKKKSDSCRKGSCPRFY